MASFTIEDATVEDKFTGLQQWWQRHCKSFGEWYLSLDEAAQRAIICAACPDIPETSPFTKRQQNPSAPLLASDLILPEFSLEGMLSSQGRIFVLFMTRRLTPTDMCLGEDIKLLVDLFEKGALPSFSNGQLSKMDTPFVDPMDPQENIRSLSPATTDESRAAVQQLLKAHRLIHAEVWLALKVRRASIATLLEKMVEQHQREVAVKPSPTYAALLLGELQQQAALLEEKQQAQTSGDQSNSSNA